MRPAAAFFKTGEPNMPSLFRALLLTAVLLLPVFDSMSLAEEPALSPTQPTPAEMAKRAGVKLPSLPWHLADFWWVFDKPIEDFRRLEIEITESCLHDNIASVRAMITSLRNQGVSVSLDDFGTGYASLSQLRSHHEP